MKEFLGQFLLVFGVLLLGVLMLVSPILQVGAAFDAGTITGTLVARQLVLVLLVRPTIRFWIGLFKHDEKE